MQEALNNVAKHSHATEATIQLAKSDGAVRCSVKDNGAGFKVRAVSSRKGDRGLGLIGIRERVEALGGAFTITSSPGLGTQLSVKLPLTKRA